MRTRPPRPIEWLLRRCLPDDVVGASIAGDLREEYERDPATRWRGIRYATAALALAVRYAGSRAARASMKRLRRNGTVSGWDRSRREMRAVAGDLRDAWRGLRRRPLSALAGAGLLACGLAASSTVFSFVEAVLLRPLPLIADADRLVRIQERASGRAPGQVRFQNLKATDLDRIAASVPSLAATAALLHGTSVPFSGPDGAIRIPALHATGGFFDVVGVQPALGRPFEALDEEPGALPVVVLSHPAWLRLFGGRIEAIGSSMTISRQSHTVIGVMPRGFDFPGGADVYLPLQKSGFASGFHVAVGLARIRPGVPIERVRAEVEAAVAALAHDEPAGGHGAGARVMRWRDAVTEPVRPAMRMLAVAAALVLALATANLGGLLTNRSTARMRELSIRRSLGATNARVLRLLLAEGMLLGSGGAVLGLLMTALTLRSVVAFSPVDLPFRDAVRIDTGVLLLTAALAVLSGVLAGLFPAVRTRRGPMTLAVRSDGLHRPARGSALLVAGQIAVAMVLVSSAAVLVRSFVTALRVDPGVQTDGILTASVTLMRSRYQSDERQFAFFREVLDSMRSTSGVTAAEVGLFGPLSGALPVEVSVDAPGRPAQRVFLNAVSPGFLPLLAVSLLDGRWLNSHDAETGERVALVSRLAASELFRAESPLGRLVHRKGEAYRIVGVVADVRQQGPLEDTRAMIYVPFRQFPVGVGTFVIAGRFDAAVLSASLRSIVRRLDPDLPLDRVEMLSATVDESLAQPRFYSVVLGIFGSLALGLAVSGLYAVVAFAASRRTFEFGVRSALGARPVDNLWLVYRQAVGLSLAGVAVGAGAAVYGTHLLRTVLYKTDPSDPAMLIVAGAITLAITLAAAITPALRAARVDPVVALRAE